MVRWITQSGRISALIGPSNASNETRLLQFHFECRGAENASAAQIQKEQTHICVFSNAVQWTILNGRSHLILGRYVIRVSEESRGILSYFELF